MARAQDIDLLERLKGATADCKRDFSLVLVQRFLHGVRCAALKCFFKLTSCVHAERRERWMCHYVCAMGSIACSSSSPRSLISAGAPCACDRRMRGMDAEWPVHSRPCSASPERSNDRRDERLFAGRTHRPNDLGDHLDHLLGGPATST
jgi:hypothetical protein